MSEPCAEKHPTNPDKFRGGPPIAFRAPGDAEWRSLSLPHLKGPDGVQERSTEHEDALIGKLREELRARRLEVLSSTDTAFRAAALDEMVLHFGRENGSTSAMVLRELGKCRGDGVAALRRALSSENPAVVRSAACSLGYLVRRDDPQVREDCSEALAPLLERREVVAGAAKGIRYALTERGAQSLLKALASSEGSGAFELFREIAWSGEGRFLEPVLRCLGVLDSSTVSALSPYVALLVKPHWIAQNLATPLGWSLGLRFGFLGAGMRSESKEPGPLLSKILGRIGLVSSGMLAALDGAGDAEAQESLLERWSTRKMELGWMLLPEEMRGTRKSTALRLDSSPEGELDCELLFAAQRESDLTNIDLKREMSPFDRRQSSQVPGRFFCLSQEGFKRVYLNHYRAAVQEAVSDLHPTERVLEEILPGALLHLAASDAETREEEWLEGWEKGLARARSAVALHPEDPKNIEEGDRYGVVSPHVWDAYDAAVAHYSVDKNWGALSSGAQGVLRLLVCADAVGKGDGPAPMPAQRVQHALALEERDRILPSIGIEVQSAVVPPEQVHGWKAALQYVGVPSPTRPEFVGVTEASFRPTRSAELLTRGLYGVRKVAFGSQGALGLHVSVRAELGDEVRYLAFPLLLQNRRGLENKFPEGRVRIGLKNLMSKGFVARARDAEALDSSEPPTSVRTEIRVCPLDPALPARAPAVDPMDGLLSSIQLLSGACCAFLKDSARDPVTSSCAEIWRVFRDEIEQLAHSFGEEASALFHAEWYASTGEYIDERLLEQLPIVQRYVEFYRWSERHSESRIKLEIRCADAVARAVARVREILYHAT